MSETTENRIELFQEAMGIDYSTTEKSMFIARPGLASRQGTSYPQEVLDAFISQIKRQPSLQYSAPAASPGLYKPIHNRYETRVLEVKPGIDTERLQGSLHHCTVEFDHMALDTRPRWAMSSTDYSMPIFYTALSYTWGPEVYYGSIVCDGFVKEITKSLEAALQQFRQPHESIMMWIDQICINQKDKKEKAQQIPLMSRIYTLASSTVIWLGEAGNGSDSALKLLEQIVSCLQFTFSQPGFGDLENLGLPASGSTDWKHLCELLCREWFTRVWII